MTWKIGVEIELLAPKGLSRLSLAERLAGPGGEVRRFFLEQSEPSLVPGQKVFHNLTLGFEARDRFGRPVAKCVDDLTLQSDLDRSMASAPGWYRVLSDDARFLRLVARNSDPSQGIPAVLEPLARLYGTEPDAGPQGMWRVIDETGYPVVLGAPLPGERERPCEIITPPIEGPLEPALEALLAPARELGFTAPIEGAVHLHFDAAPLRDAGVFLRLVSLFYTWRTVLRQLLRTNPSCRRLGAWPEAMLERVRQPGFEDMDWDDARAVLNADNPSKYVDFNVRNLLARLPGKDTFEVRILPVSLTGAPIAEAAALIEGLLRRALKSEPVPWREPMAWSRPAAEALLAEALPERSARLPWLTRLTLEG